MSVSNEVIKVELTAGASQTVFPFTNIAILTDSDLRVYQNDVQLSLGPDYTVSLNGTAPSDGDVILASGATAGDVIWIERDIPRLQPTVYNPGTAFPAKSHENALDRLTLEISDLHHRVNYTPLFARGRAENLSWRLSDMPDAVTSKIPVYDPATKIVSWSDTGSPTSTVDFSALTGTLDVSGDDARVPGFTKGFANAILRDIRAYLEDYKSVKDFGAVGDGVADDRDAINDALATGGKIYFPPGTYNVTGTLSLVSNTTICGAGMEVTKVTSALDHSFFIGNDVDDIEISDMTIEGIHPGGTGSNTTFNAITLTHTGGQQRRFKLHDLFIRNMTGRGIIVADNSADVWVYNCLVQNCLIGIFLFKMGFAANVYGNICRDCRLDSIFVDDATTGDSASTNIPPFWVTVANNICINGGFDPTQTGFGIAVSASTGVTVTGNVVDDIGDPGVNSGTGIVVNSGQDDFDESETVTVTGNVVTRCAGTGIIVEASHDVIVANNILRNNHNWTSPVANGAEIVVRDHSTSASGSDQIFIHGNSIHNTGIANARATIGIDVQDVNNTQIHIGLNAIDNFTTDIRSLADAGDIVWHTYDHLATLPTHDDGFRGRQVYDTTRNLMTYNTGTKWTSLAPLAWCTFDGTDADPITIIDGVNVTNVSKAGAGSYTVNFAVTFSNTDYGVVVTTSGREAQAGVPTTTTVAVSTRDSAGTAADAGRITVVAFGTP